MHVTIIKINANNDKIGNVGNFVLVVIYIILIVVKCCHWNIVFYIN